MTNEEAIETLKANYLDACFKQLREAVDMAIEALKEQPEHDQKQRADSISRQDAIDVILADKIVGKTLIVLNELGEGNLVSTLNDACDRHIRDIEKLPSV